MTNPGPDTTIKKRIPNNQRLFLWQKTFSYSVCRQLTIGQWRNFYLCGRVTAGHMVIENPARSWFLCLCRILPVKWLHVFMQACMALWLYHKIEQLPEVHLQVKPHHDQQAGKLPQCTHNGLPAPDVLLKQKRTPATKNNNEVKGSNNISLRPEGFSNRILSMDEKADAKVMKNIIRKMPEKNNSQRKVCLFLLSFLKNLKRGEKIFRRQIKIASSKRVRLKPIFSLKETFSNAMMGQSEI